LGFLNLRGTFLAGVAADYRTFRKDGDLRGIFLACLGLWRAIGSA